MPVAIGQVDPVTAIERELAERFAGQLPNATIETLAEEAVAAFDKARVREFVPLLAGRRARLRAKQIVAVDHTAGSSADSAVD